MKKRISPNLDNESAIKELTKLQESEELFRSTFEQAAVGIAHVGTNGNFIRINQKFCDMNISEGDVPSFLISDEIIKSLSMQNGSKKEINPR